MATLDDLVDEQNTIAVELDRIANDPEATEESSGNLRDTLIQRWEQIEPERERLTAQLEKLNVIKRTAAANASIAEPGDGGGGDARRWDGQGPEFMRRLDPFADMDAVRGNRVSGKDLIARASNVIETHDRRHLLPGDRGDEATRNAQMPSIARHVLLTGGDDYIEAFRTYLNDPQGQGQIARTALLTSTATAGFLLPYVLDTSIVLTNSGSVNPYRQISRVERTTSNAWQGVNSAGVGVAMLNEGALASDTGSAVGQIQIIPQKAAAWVTGSFEVMGDTDYASQLPGMFDDAKYVLEEQKFALGTGGTTGPNAGEPLGIANALTATQKVVASNAGTAGGSFGGTAVAAVGDVYALNAALGPRFRMSPNVAWVANITTINKIRALDQFGGGSFLVNLGDDRPNQLLSKGLYESPSLISAGTAGGTAIGSATAIFGDFSKFVIVDRVGSTMLFDPLLKSAGTGNIPSGNQGWFYYWRFGSGVATANAFRWLCNG